MSVMVANLKGVAASPGFVLAPALAWEPGVGGGGGAGGAPPRHEGGDR